MSGSITATTAVISGSFLSGAMMSLNLIAVPVLLDQATEASALLSQWARMYYYGQRTMPFFALGTFALYALTCFGRSRNNKPWRIFALAAAMTLTMLPFTWVFMVATNNELFRLEAASKTSQFTMELTGAKELVAGWSQLHFIRCLFPLLGAITGSLGARRV